MNKKYPKYITHYYLSNRKPFKSLSEISNSESDIVIEELNDLKKQKLSLRQYPEWYLNERKKAECFLHEQFIKRGGEPETKYPIYFTLGSSSLLKKVNKQSSEIRINLSDIPNQIISFTYRDSMLLYEKMIQKNEKFFVYLKSDLPKMIKENGFPLDNYEIYENEKYINYIEAQIWSSEFLIKFITK